MPPRWHRRGLLIPPPSNQPWGCSHAALPVPDVLDSRNLDVYYSPRDCQGRAHVAVGRVEVGQADDGLILAASAPKPVLSPGPLGAFDDSGVTVSCLVHSDDAALL